MNNKECQQIKAENEKLRAEVEALKKQLEDYIKRAGDPAAYDIIKVRKFDERKPYKKQFGAYLKNPFKILIPDEELDKMESELNELLEEATGGTDADEIDEYYIDFMERMELKSPAGYRSEYEQRKAFETIIEALREEIDDDE